MRGDSGAGLLDVLVALAIVALAVLAAAPAVVALRGHGRAEAGARYLSGLFAAERFRSVAVHRARGFWFERVADGWRWHEVVDGNGNGLRTAEIRDGTDATVAGPFRLEDRVSRVRLGIPGGGPYPDIPPRRGVLHEEDDPVRFGRSDVVSFAPLGSASSGTIFVTDGERGLCGVVLFGPTARLRVWRFDRKEWRWKL